MTVIKYRWKVEPELTGPYAAFQKRGWPSAKISTGECIAYISCDDSYSYHVAQSKHLPLTLYIRASIKDEDKMRTNCRWRWLKFKEKFISLADAKNALQLYIESHPNHNFALENEA